MRFHKNNFSRRTLLALSACALFSFSGCSTPAVKTPAVTSIWSDAELPARVIDAHMHVHFTGKTGEDVKFPDTSEEFIRQLRSVNGVGSVAHTAPGKRERPDFKGLGITPCYGVGKDPRSSEAERAIRDEGFRCFKIYLGYEWQWADHPKYRAVYRIAEKYGVPVVFHTGDTLDSNGKLKYSDPLTIDEIAVEYRKVKFVIAHLGNPWIQSAAEVAYKNPNVFIDVSALLIGDLRSYSDADLEEFVIKPIRWAHGYVENEKKLMFGTDFPLTNVADYLHVVKRAIPKDQWDRFFYLNAAEVFGIKH
jgi:hypothetical protein